MTASGRAPVSAWGELPGDKRVSGALRVLVGGQLAGTIARKGDIWHASWRVRSGSPVTQTEHQTAAGALTAVLRSGFARGLGARTPSPVFWSATASRLLARAYRDAP